jgi:hypothetical protein
MFIATVGFPFSPQLGFTIQANIEPRRNDAMKLKTMILAAFCTASLAGPALAQSSQFLSPDNGFDQPPGKSTFSPGNPYRSGSAPSGAPVAVPSGRQNANAAHQGYGVSPAPDQSNAPAQTAPSDKGPLE